MPPTAPTTHTHARAFPDPVTPPDTMNTDVIQKRFNDFKSRFSQLFGPKTDGYEELDTLERPLVSDMDNPLYEEEDGAYAPPVERGGERERGHHRHQSSNFHVPSQQEELEVLTVLSKDAAEILWEMVLVEVEGASAADVQDMKSRSEQLRAQLRGMLNDYDGSDEMVMCRALEAWDSLNAALDGDKGETGDVNAGDAGDVGEGAEGGALPPEDLLGLDAVDAPGASSPSNPSASGPSAKQPIGEQPPPSQNAHVNLLDF